MPGAVVQIEGVGNVQFPDSMSDADISAAAHKLYTGAAAQQISANPPGVPKPSPQMETSALGELAPRPVPRTAHAGASQEGMPGFEGMYAANDPEKAAAMTGSGIAAAGVIGGVIPKIASKVAPYVAPAAATYAINRARELPVVGPIINKIPFAEMIPWMFAGKKGETPIERDATRQNVPYAGEEIPEAGARIERDATRSNVPYAGEEPPAQIAKPEPEILKAAPARGPSKAEWEAGHQIESQIEGTPKISPEEKTAEYLKTPEGKRFAKIYRQTIEEHKAGNVPEMEAEPLIPKKPPEGTVVPQTAEQMQQALEDSLKKVKKQQ